MVREGGGAPTLLSAGLKRVGEVKPGAITTDLATELALLHEEHMMEIEHAVKHMLKRHHDSFRSRVEVRLARLRAAGMEDLSAWRCVDVPAPNDFHLPVSGPKRLSPTVRRSAESVAEIGTGGLRSSASPSGRLTPLSGPRTPSGMHHEAFAAWMESEPPTQRPARQHLTIVKPPSREAAGSDKPRRLSLREAHSQRGTLGSYEVNPGSYFRFVHRPFFGMLSAVVIMMSAIYNGIQLEVAIQGEGLNELNGWLIGDMIFTLAFTVELVLRYLAGRRYFLIGNDRFFTVDDRWWNLFDAGVVASSILDLTLTLAGSPVAAGFSILKVVRLVRILRIFRAGGAIPVVRSLRTMLHSLANSVTAFVPALFLLFVVIYMFSLMFMEGFNLYMINNIPPGNEGAVPDDSTISQLDHRFGSVQLTFWTLIGMISGGVDWLDVLMLVRQLGAFHVYLLMGYIFTVSFGLMNVLTGICVNAATQACMLNHELAVDSALSEKHTLSRELTMLFMECDVDHTNSLSWEEFQEKLADERIKAYFRSLDLDMSSVLKVYELLDGNGDGELELSEFIEGCLAYRGNAKAVDICILQRENKQMLDKLGALEASLSFISQGPVTECLDDGCQV